VEPAVLARCLPAFAAVSLRGALPEVVVERDVTHATTLYLGSPSSSDQSVEANDADPPTWVAEPRGTRLKTASSPIGS